MKAMICTKYGAPDVLQLRDVKTPNPRDNEVLIKIHATTVTTGDCRIRGFDVPPLAWLPFRLAMGISKPRNGILGFTLAGVVEAVGKNVTRFTPGEAVFGVTGMAGGSYAEYVCLPEDAVLTQKPEAMSFEQAAAIPFGGPTSLHFLQKGEIQSGQKTLIYGASGSLGTNAVQLAKYFGAHVIGVCSTANIELVKSLGADAVIDYTQTDFTTLGEKYDIIYDTIGKSPFSGSVAALQEHGVYLRAVHMTLSAILHGIWTGLTSKKKVIGGVAKETTEALEFLKTLFESGTLKPVIDKTYPLEQLAAAHAYVDQGHKRGNVVISIAR